jgi:ATP-binding cassette, subfamily B, bacterial MsbA
LVLATLCSVGVAALWSANIGAMYPVIQVTLNDESVQNRLASELENKQALLAKAETQLASFRATLPPNAITQADTDLQVAADTQPAMAVAGGDAQESRKQLRSLEKQRDRAASALAWQQWQYNLADRYLPHSPFHTICFIMLVVVASTLVKHLLILSNDLLIGRVSTTIVRSIRMRIFDQALSFDRRTYQNYGTSTLLASITTSSEMLSTGLVNFFGAAIREPLRVIGCLIGAAIICPRLLLLSLVLAPLMILVVHWFNKRIKGIARSMLGRNAGFHEVILEALSNIFTVQAYTMEDVERHRFSQCTQDMQKCSLRMILYTGMSKPITELIGVGMIAITVCAGAYLIVNKETHIFFLRICNEPLTASDLMIFFGMLIGASDPLRKMSGVFTSIYAGSIAADTLYPMLDRAKVLSEPAQPATVPHPHHELTLQTVSFSYTAGNPVLRDVNLRIPFGKTIAIVGANGSGKSTLIQLLSRFYDPDSGMVAFDNVDYRQMSVLDIRKRIALVCQHTELFNRSVLENIRYGSPEATREQVIQAAQLAHAHEFITKVLEQDYDTVVGHGGQRLSGGQRQRIALARAILRRPEILILDESTSQIDMSSELQIRQSLSELKGSCTIIIIAHREALLALADDIYEVRDGELKSPRPTLQASA